MLSVKKKKTLLIKQYAEGFGGIRKKGFAYVIAQFSTWSIKKKIIHIIYFSVYLAQFIGAN